MIVWLDRKQRYRERVGVQGDVLRADEYAAVLSIDDALARAETEARQIVGDAHAQAAAIRQAAIAHAEATDAAAQARWEAAAAQGYEEGLRRAHDEANAVMLHETYDAYATMASAQARLAHLVMAAVERVVCESDRDALFARVTLRLQRLIDEASFVTLTVHPDDVARAREALGLLRDTVGRNAAFDVVPDAAAPAGSCRCEWDNGVFVTSLDEEMASLQRLLERELMASPAPTSFESADEGQYASANIDENPHEMTA
ncbi:type III secretion system stator protein SctL [Cupriavidus pampae]|uniref:Type 3 secretion system stator protein n=1 Tax=Cupriavidus pampae TaxID=659251 RepID=A0ABN7Y2Z6_9BURK|nr:type III secretion system stator protein SctL [Cupriavidus pampae]CAG9166904.1 hypothetical protein LMG32289_01226 [Cupriavidus pampae]